MSQFESANSYLHLAAQSDTRTFYEFAPLVPLSQWWHLFALLAIVALMVWFVVAVYRRDSGALPTPIKILLTSLRVLAVAGLVLFVLGPQKRSETRVINPSELAILVDTSLSMGLIDTDEPGIPAKQRRIDAVTELFESSEFLDRLRQNHQITVYRFGDSPQPEEFVTLAKLGAPAISGAEPTESVFQRYQRSLQLSNRLGKFAIAALGLGLGLLLLTVILYVRGAPQQGWSLPALGLMISCLLLVTGIACLAVTDLASSQFGLGASLGWREIDVRQFAIDRNATGESDPASQPETPTAIDWARALSPAATATRLGQALSQIVEREKGSAFAGIVLVTDGRHNSGPPPARAITAASDANIPIYAIGIGNDQPPRNVRISDLQAPPRVLPNDKFKIKSIIQAYGMAGQSVRVSLVSSEQDRPETETIEDEQSVRLMGDGEPLNVEFEVLRQEQGRRKYVVQVDAPPGDLDDSDNSRATTVEILLRKTKVLLIAGGPTRDYQFLRNLLYRDDNINTDVWLQMAKSGADQESDKLLFEFPTSRDQLYQYDCLVAFDPDWRSLSLEQTRWLERWISEKAGGMVVVAGPVFTPEWTRKPRGDEAIDLIRRLYPVSFYSQGSAALKLGRFGGENPYPLAFTREGRTAEYLWLGDSASDSAANWNRFSGVYGYYAVNEPKAGADILAHFSDPATAIDDQLPIYLASHFYGAGRVLFQASGEIWRLRDVDVEFFQDYYSNLIRWASQGRLMRNSTRGVLLVDKTRCWVGDQIVVKAILRDANDQPLIANHVNALLKRPGQPAETMQLVNIQNAARPGTFASQFLANSEGNFEIRLPIPQSPEDQELTAEISSTIPELEKKNPQRNDLLLSEIAEKTGGQYYPGIDQSVLLGKDGLSDKIPTADSETFLPDTPDQLFIKKAMAWLVGWLTLVMALEWTIRRLHKLA